MSLTVSPQIRLVALVGALAAAGLGAFMFTTRGAPSSVDSAALPKVKPLYHGRKVAAHPAPPKKQTVTPARHVAPKVPSKPPVVATNGLPMVLVQALARHPVVVVALYDPQARIDGISLAEAQAGAAVAGAGFVPLDVLDTQQAGPLMKLLGVLPDPAVLVYRRPGDLAARFDGFADRDTVAQAATNATPDGLARQAATERATPVVTRDAWARRASKVCSRTWANAPRIAANAPRAKFLKWAPGALARQQQLIAQLAALSLPTYESDRLLANRFLTAARRFHTTDSTLFLAIKRNDSAATLRLLNVEVAEIAQANEAARAVGATGCAAFDK
ncbi:MAG TPA: hypothetical protein VF101_12600 [Gaiellaceae bacterium]